MKRFGRIDANQPAIVKALRTVGATVQPLSAVGGGCPDLLVGYHGTNYLLEVKDPARDSAHQRLTPAQGDWHASWRGAVTVVRGEQEAIAVVTSPVACRAPEGGAA